MKSKRGFTLIELLAIIVILAIIAVITVPIILNIIENSKKGAAVDSAYGYKDAISQWYVSKLQDDGNTLLNGTYVVEDGKINNEDLLVSGITPTNGRLKYENNVLISGCLVIDGYEVKYENGEFVTTGKGECIPGFEDASWAEIKSKLQTDRSAYLVGAEKEVEMDIDGDGVNESYTVRLANVTSCENTWTGSKTACGVVIEFVDIVALYDFQGSWPAANVSNSLYQYVNTTLFNKLPAELRADDMIIDTYTISGSGHPSIPDGTSTDKLYILAPLELSEYGSASEKDGLSRSKTKLLEYYSGKYYTATESKSYNGNPQVFWTRSFARGYSNSYICVGTNGGMNGTCTIGTAQGVAPAFRILD